MRWSKIGTAVFCALASIVPTYAQKSTPTTNTTCSFADGKQISVRYRRPAAKGKKEIPPDRVWSPGDTPMYLFTQTDLLLGEFTIPAGAYGMYVLAGKDKWMLILNKNVTEGSTYQQQQDLLRVPMQMGQLSESANFKVVFGHVAPKQCNMRIYYGKAGTWAEFREK